jgi:surface polysaccharide O-acyltransferase-like enzyme
MEKIQVNPTKSRSSRISELMLVILMAIPLFFVIIIYSARFFPELGIFDLIILVPLIIPISLLLSMGIVRVVFKNHKIKK